MRRDPVKLSEVLAECFRETESPAILTAWADAQDQIPGQLELPLECTCFPVPEKYWTTHYGAVDPATMKEWNPDCAMHPPEIPAQGLGFCDEVNSEFTSSARPGADWGTWEVPC